MSDDQWWYDLNTKQAVQESQSSTKATDRLGPYASREEAEHAMEKVAERNEAYDHDPKWEDD